MTESRLLAETRAMSANSRSSSPRLPARVSSWSMPMTALSGVRISWLMLARNSLLARLADSAARRAAMSRSSLSRRRAISATSSSLVWTSSSLVEAISSLAAESSSFMAVSCSFMAVSCWFMARRSSSAWRRSVMSSTVPSMRAISPLAS